MEVGKGKEALEFGRLVQEVSFGQSGIRGRLFQVGCLQVVGPYRSSRVVAQFTTPPLTTVQISQVELATRAFDALFKGMKNAEGVSPTHEYVLTSHLVLRGTTMLTSKV